MGNLKLLVKTVWIELTWLLARILLLFVKKKASNEILLVPASNLDGGFGEDIMVSSFIENFSNSKPVTVFTWAKIDRADYLSRYPNVKLMGGFTDTINFVKAVFLVRKYGLVYIIGADIMDGAYSVLRVITRLRLMKMANMMKIDSQISGFSISEKVYPKIKPELVSISQFSLIKARDIESYNRLAHFISSDRLLLTNDLAFICPSVPESYNTGAAYEKFRLWVDSQKQNFRKIVAVCPNSIQAQKYGLDKYITSFRSLLDRFVSKGNFSFVFLYHDLRPLCGRESDLTISESLFDYYLSNSDVSVFYSPDIRNGVELKGYLELADFTITGRMHFGISGLTYGKPMFGIAYANKFEGMLRSFDLNPSWCLVEYTNMHDNNIQVGKFVNNFELIKHNIGKQVSAVKDTTFENYSLAHV